MKISSKKIILVTLIAVQPILFFSVINIASAEVPVRDAKVRSETKDIRKKTSWLVKKENFFDSSLGYTVARTAINVLTESVVNWINRGFDGNPAFVDDFGGFLREIADRETAHFI